MADIYDETGRYDVHVVLTLKGGTRCVTCKKQFTEREMIDAEPVVWNDVPTISFRHAMCPKD